MPHLKTLMQVVSLFVVAALSLSACGDGEIEPGPSALNDSGYCSDVLNNQIVELAQGKLLQPEKGFYEIERTIDDITAVNKFEISWSCDLFAKFEIVSKNPGDDPTKFLSLAKTLAGLLTGIPEKLAQTAIANCTETVLPKLKDKNYRNGDWRDDWHKTGARGVEVLCFQPKFWNSERIMIDRHMNALVPVIRFRKSR